MAPQEGTNILRNSIDLEKVTYYIQRRSLGTGEWRVRGKPIVGWTRAYKILHVLKAKAKAKNSSDEYRVVSKREAEKYREAWQDAQHFARFGEPRFRSDG